MSAKARGFTLIEILFVLSLIGIMLAIAVPSFSSFISNYRATSAVNELMQGVTLTRGEALKRGRRVMMVPNYSNTVTAPGPGGSWVNGWTVFVDVNGDKSYNSGDTLIYRHDALPTSVVITAAGASTLAFSGTNYVSFDGTGYPRTAPPVVNVLNGGIVVTDSTGSISNVRTLCLANFGRPRIVSGAPADPCTSG